MIKSGLFNSVTVGDRELAESPPPSQDVLIWESSNGWRLRAGAGPVQALKYSDNADELAKDPGKWIGIVRDAVILAKKKQATGSVETSEPLTLQAAPDLNSVPLLPVRYQVGAVSYAGLDAAGRGMREQAAKEVNKLLPIGTRPYESVLLIFKTHKEFENRTIGTPSEMFMPFTELKDDVADEVVAPALTNANLFSNVTTVYADDGETQDFRGNQYKIWSSNNGWIVADKHGHRQVFKLFPAGPGEVWELPNLNRTVSNVKAALEELSK